MRFRTPRNRAFWFGLISGVALVLAGRIVVNQTSIPDRLIAPLLMSDSTANADAIVVLGAGVIGDCIPNLNGMRRVVRGVRLWRDERAPLLVITGGAGGGRCPVADAMAGFARELGVAPERMVIERQSHDTWENGELSAPLLRDRGVRSILLVTDRLHMRRAAGVFARQGFTVEPAAVPIYEGHPDNVSMLSAGIRETVALAYYRLRRWTTTPSTAAPELHQIGVGHPNGEVTEIPQSGPRRVERAMYQTAMTGTARPIVVLGASYAAGWRVTDIGGVPVQNAGVTGQQSFEMLARFDRDVAAVRPRAVVLWGFINDIFRADDVDRALIRVRESYTEMISRARAEQIEPVLATEVTIRPPKTVVETLMATLGWVIGKESYQDRVNGHVVTVNAWLRELGHREGLLVLDLQRTLASGPDGPRRWSYAADDGSHISEEGYRVVTEYAVPRLVQHLNLAAAGTSGQR